MTKNIPNLIHQIWVGPDPIPVKSEKFIRDIKKLHPDFKYKLWTDKDIKKTNFKNYELIKKSKSYAQKADIMRYEILYRYGGIYLDIDFEIFKNLEPLLVNELVLCSEDMFTDFHISIGFIASTKHNHNLKRCVDGLNDIDFNDYINFSTGPVYFRKNITFDKNVTLLKSETLYPVHWIQHKIYSLFIKPEYDRKLFTDSSYGIHHWNHNW